MLDKKNSKQENALKTNENYSKYSQQDTNNTKIKPPSIPEFKQKLEREK